MIQGKSFNPLNGFHFVIQKVARHPGSRRSCQTTEFFRFDSPSITAKQSKRQSEHNWY
jgi:hypothetical protein